MLRLMHKSKIHMAAVTEANLNYKGSITIDEELMEKADLKENEKVLVVNVNTGDRFETYVITGGRNTGIICLNGAAARLVQVGDKVIIISFAMYADSELDGFKPSVVFVDGNNRAIIE